MVRDVDNFMRVSLRCTQSRQQLTSGLYRYLNSKLRVRQEPGPAAQPGLREGAEDNGPLVTGLQRGLVGVVSTSPDLPFD